MYEIVCSQYLGFSHRLYNTLNMVEDKSKDKSLGDKLLDSDTSLGSYKLLGTGEESKSLLIKIPVDSDFSSDEDEEEEWVHFFIVNYYIIH